MRHKTPVAMLSAKTRAILLAIKDVDLSAATIVKLIGMPANEVHPKLQNCVRSGYAVVASRHIVENHWQRTYRAAPDAFDHSEQSPPFETVDGYDCRALLEVLGPKREALPAGVPRIVYGAAMSSTKNEEEEEAA